MSPGARKEMKGGGIPNLPVPGEGTSMSIFKVANTRQGGDC
jgi:hypothetical protein